MTTETVLFFISAFVTGLICFVLVKLRIGDIHDSRIRGFFPLCLAAMGWIMMNAAVFVIAPTDYAAFYTARMLFACTIPYLNCWFFLNFSESKLAKSRLLRYTLAAVCAADLLALLSNPLHRLYFVNYSYPFPERGIFGVFHIVTLSAVMALAYATLFPYIAKNYRRYPLLLLTGFGAVAPYALYMVYALQSAKERYDFSPLGFFFSVILFAFFSYASKMSHSRQVKLNYALSEITKSPDISAGDIKKAAETLAQKGCLALDANRLSIWMMDKSARFLENVTCYQNATGTHIVRENFDLLGREAYLNHIRAERLLVINDMRQSNPASDLSKYEPNMCAMLDAPIRIGGQLVGVVCVEQDHSEGYPQKREWTVSEQNFASSLADLMALALESAERRSILSRTESMLSNLPGMMYQCLAQPPDYTLTFVSRGSEALIGYTPEELIGTSSLIFCDIAHPEDVGPLRRRIGETLAVGLPMESVLRIIAKDGEEKWVWERSRVVEFKPDGTPHLLEGFYTDITEQRRLETAAAANQAKTQFLANMSHEMRTPLSAVIGLSELVLENEGLSKENEVYLDKIYNAGSTLLSIVNDILDISKIEAGKFESIKQEYDVPSLINDAITQNILRIHSKPVEFTLNISENTPARLCGDDMRVKQIVSNLLSNAFKYTEEGTVELHVGHEHDGDSVWMTFCVSDTGVGIRPCDINRLFADYTRFEEATNRAGGTGLGLSITKKLVELMDGSISAESTYGKGSVFTAKIRQQFVSETVIGNEMAEHLRNFRYTTSKRRSGSQLSRVRIPYARVLVVDDNLTNLDIAQGLMKPYGMEIDCVTSGPAAIEAIRAENPKYSAIFMDHMMPGMDGVEAVRIIREEIVNDYARSIPIIALTANAVVGNQERFISQGFNAFVSKPIDIFRLDEVIRKWVWNKNEDAALDIPREFVDRRRMTDRRKGGDRRTGDRRNGFAPQANPAGIPKKTDGIDWMKGLQLFGDKDAYIQVLRSFAVNTMPLLENITEVDETALAGYAITVHGIKSSSRGVCADALGALAESLEFAAKDGNLDYILQHNPNFLTAAHTLIEEIKALLNNAEKLAVKPKKGKPGEAELTRLCDACANYDIDGIEAAMREIEGYEYTDDGGLADWLRDNVARLNYTQVVEKIIQMTKVVEE